jgi:hypothetical protein
MPVLAESDRDLKSHRVSEERPRAHIRWSLSPIRPTIKAPRHSAAIVDAIVDFVPHAPRSDARTPTR